MSIKNLGLSIWNSATSKTNSSPTARRSSQSSSTTATTPVGFGLPSPEDPDPFGVRALELAGLEIKEAGTSIRPSIDAFEYRPSPTSPVFRLSTQSIDLVATGDSRRNSRRNSKRNSKRSLFSLRNDQPASRPESSASHLRDSTIDTRNSISEPRNSTSERRSSLPSPPCLPPRHPSPTSSAPSPTLATFAIDSGIVQSPAVEESVSRSMSVKSTSIQLPETIDETAENESDDEFDDLDEDEDIIIEEVSTSTIPARPTVVATPVAIKAKVVSIRRRGPPALPLKSPLRPRFFGTATQENLSEGQDETSSTESLSPDKDAFDKSEVSPNPWSAQTSLQDNDSIRQKDAGRDSLSISDHGASSHSPKLTGTEPKDTNDTSVKAVKAVNSDLLLPDSTKDIPPDSSNGGATQTKTSESTDIVLAPTNILDSVTPPISEHKSSISGSTLASITEHTSSEKLHPDQSLASLIRQGLSGDFADDDDYYTEDKISHQHDRNEEPSSDYEDDEPVTSVSSHDPIYSTPGAFGP